jgi:hypothetical protein
MHHAMNYAGFRMGPELQLVQDRMYGSPEPYPAGGGIRS